MEVNFDKKNILIAIFLVFLTVFLGYFTNQADFLKISLGYCPFFLLYIYILNRKNHVADVHFFVLTGIFLRFILIFSFPNLSDDIYRFIWDGRLLINGFNPFDHLPKYYIEQSVAVNGIDAQLFSNLNSPEYFTIYPPVAQLTFAVAVWLFPHSIWGSAIVMKSCLFLFETGSILLIINILKKLKLPVRNVLIYALNPLIIIEICGNLHFEGGMIFFLLLSVFILIKIDDLTNRRLFYAATAFALSIASKLLPLIFLPFFIKRLGWKKSVTFFSIIGVILLLLFIPLMNGVFIQNFGNSLNLYFQKFEFNASIYYLFRWLGFKMIGWNMIAVIGPTLAICTPIAIFWMAFREKINPSDWQSLFVKMLWAICIYLFFTTTVHPWYIALPLVLCCFTKYRFPVVWSGLIWLTYINYSYPVYHENLWIVGAEYLILGIFLIYEGILRHKFL